MQTPINYIQSKGWEHKKQSGQLVLKVCPFCKDEKYHFYMDPNEGPWFCHKCNAKGNLWTLKKRMGDIQEVIKPAFKKPKYKRPYQDQAQKYHQALLKDSGALNYLDSRGIYQESIKRFKLGLSQENGTRWITIPHYQGKTLENIKFRSLPPKEKTFKRVAGCKSILFNADALQGQKEVFITEGEIDGISLIQEGIENVVSGTTGAGSFDPEWIDQLKALKKIYIVYDSDEKGQKGARSLAKRLGYSRCFNVELPEGQDANDFFNNGHDIFDFQKLIQEAHRFDLPGVISINTAIDLLQREKSLNEAESELLTPWDNVNHIIKGFNPGDLIILSAPPKTGKTTWALNISTGSAFSGYPILFLGLICPKPFKDIHVQYHLSIKIHGQKVHDIHHEKVCHFYPNQLL